MSHPLYKPPVSTNLLPSSPPLQSLSVRLANRFLNISDQWVEDMLTAFGGSLKRISLGNCVVGNDCVRKICRMCPELYRLELAIPTKEIRPFTLALTQSSTLQILIDVSDPHASHNSRVALSRDNVKYMMKTVRALRKVECDGRIWTGYSTAQELCLSLERHKTTSSHHWFIPNING